MRAAVDGVLAAWDGPALRALLAGATFNKGRALPPNAFAAVERLRHGLDAEGLLAAGCLARETLHESLNKRKVRTLPEHPALVACAALEPALVALDHAWMVSAVHELDTRFHAAKEEARVLAFDDLLLRLRDALRDPQRGPRLATAIRARFPAVLVDEFQDTDPVQCEIFTTLFARDAQLVLVGDPKQAIYAFRGADLDTYLETAAKADRHFHLDTNWRSSAALIAAINGLFAGAQRPFLAEHIAFYPVHAAGQAERIPLLGDSGPPLRWWLIDSTRNKEEAYVQVLDRLAAEASRLLAGGLRIGAVALAPRDLAVLVRTNRQALAVQKALAALGIPAVVGGTGDVLESAEAEELACVLGAIADPGDAARLRGALASRLWGWSAGDLVALNADDQRWQALSERIEQWRSSWQRDGLGALLEHLLDAEGWAARLLAGAAGERCLTNLRHLRELLQTAEDEQHLTPTGLLAWFADARGHGRLERERVELRLESDADAVRILTMHTAKGLEFPVVFCPFLWEAATLHKDVSSGAEPVATRLAGERVVAWGDPEALARAEVDALGESLRLTYVALTRAVHRCYVTWADTDRNGLSPLGYLLTQPSGAATGDELAWSAEVREHAQGADRQATLHALIAAHPTTMAMATIAPPVVIAAACAPSSGTSRSVVLTAGQLNGWRITSFTGLSVGAEATLRDHADPPALPATSPPSGLHAFSAGPRAGSCLHHWLERLDWQQPVRLAPLEEALARFGLDALTGAEPLNALLAAGEHLRTAIIPGPEVALAAISADRRQAEWAFHLPLAELRPRDLQRLFASHGSARSRNTYAPQLAQLSGQTLRGFLAGFVDLVFEQAGRWWVLDWKSNRLGNDASAYHPDALWQAMVDHHYVLQQQLYLLALHRHLASRVRDYDPHRHLGGAVYVFLRGLDGGQPWFSETADIALITALDQLLIEPALT